MTKKTLTSSLYFLLLAIYSIWWVLLLILVPAHDSDFNGYYADTYGVLAGIGGFIGIVVARKWDFLKSYVGKALIFLSSGLLFQFLGQVSYTIQYYAYDIENAYPSFGEVFYFGSIPLYIVGIWYLAKASGFTVKLESFLKRPSTLVIPVLLIGLSYFLFIYGYDSTDLPFSIVFLDHAYPIGQALFISLALLTFYATRGLLGGVMKGKVIFVLISLVFQYVADSLFIYETRAELWYPGGFSDLLFVISYFLMAVALIQFYTVDEDLKRKRQLS